MKNSDSVDIVARRIQSVEIFKWVRVRVFSKCEIAVKTWHPDKEPGSLDVLLKNRPIFTNKINYRQTSLLNIISVAKSFEQHNLI